MSRSPWDHEAVLILTACGHCGPLNTIKESHLSPHNGIQPGEHKLWSAVKHPREAAGLSLMSSSDPALPHSPQHPLLYPQHRHATADMHPYFCKGNFFLVCSFLRPSLSSKMFIWIILSWWAFSYLFPTWLEVSFPSSVFSSYWILIFISVIKYLNTVYRF